MSHRQYGVQPGTYDRPSTGSRPPVSPVASQASWGRSSQLPSAPVSAFPSPTRTRAPPLSTAPVPPRHSQGPPSPTKYRQQSITTPNEDHFGNTTAGGGLTGLALGMANGQPRDSGVQALRDIDNLFGGGRYMTSPSPEPEYTLTPPPPMRPVHRPVDSQNSIAPLMVHKSSPPRQAPSPTRSQPPMADMPRGYNYQGDGYDPYVNPHDIADDGDDDLEDTPPRQHRRSHLVNSMENGAGVGAAAGGSAGVLKAFGARDPSGNYGPVPGGYSSRSARDPEKSEWMRQEKSGKRRTKCIIGIIVAIVIIGAIVGGVVGGVLASKNHHSSSSSSSNSSASNDKGLYNINSPQVKALLNNTNLHRVFPGMDYTPLNAQYPACLTVPPNQNNITLDVAMLAQLTPAIRLYGTDCNQTQMLLTAIDQLGYNDTVKVWLGVWLENNATTNTRQLQQMYDVLDMYPSSHFAGVIVGNEVLFRQDMTEAELGQQLLDVRNNLTAKNIDLPVATSDLGDDWTASLAADTDIVMSNVHPFFAGVTPDDASAWAWDFWQEHDVVLTGSGTNGSTGYPKNIISEIGWPSTGGNDCGTDSGCPNATAGAVASIANMNTFMEGWVCDSLKNGTTYFWFEAFDEPWKVIYNTATDGWESKWGLMDANRNLKDGLTIPDCDGQTVDKPY